MNFQMKIEKSKDFSMLFYEIVVDFFLPLLSIFSIKQSTIFSSLFRISLST